MASATISSIFLDIESQIKELQNLRGGKDQEEEDDRPTKKGVSALQLV